MRRNRGPGIFPESLPDQLATILTWVGTDAGGNPRPFIDEDWTLEVCRFVDGDPSRLEVIFRGILGGRLRLTRLASRRARIGRERGQSCRRRAGEDSI